MRKSHIIFICLLAFASCQKVWVEDLQERAYDTIRGVYELKTVTWDAPEPIDIDGDGVASFDYYQEWNQVYSGGPGYSSVSNERGRLQVPYVVDSNADWSGPVNLQRRHLDYSFDIEAVIEGNTSRLVLTPESSDTQENTGWEVELSGYGEITLRTNITLTVLTGPEQTEEVSGHITLYYVRTKYTSE